MSVVVTEEQKLRMFFDKTRVFFTTNMPKWKTYFTYFICLKIRKMLLVLIPMV